MFFKTRLKFHLRGGMLMGLSAALSLSASPIGRPLRLVRRYRPGSRIVYRTQITTRIKMQSDPSGLRSYLHVPDVVVLRRQNTLVVQAVRPDKSAKIQDRFDNFEVSTTVTSDPSRYSRAVVRKVENSFTHAMTGQILIARYGPRGRLLGFTGATEMLNRLQLPVRDAARWALKLMLTQPGGYGFYPDCPVRVGGTWKNESNVKLSEAVPLISNHEDSYRLASLTRYDGVRAGVITFDLANSIHPVHNTGPSPGLFALLRNEGVRLYISASGAAHGRAIVALDDGRILREASVFRESFQGSLQGLPGIPLPATGSAVLKIETENVIDMVELRQDSSRPRVRGYRAISRRMSISPPSGGGRAEVH